MEFRRLLFYYNLRGLPRMKPSTQPNNPPELTPLEVTAEAVRASHFYLESEYGRYGNVVRIIRMWKDRETDPYNFDGWPASVWTSIVLPSFDFGMGRLTISGLEHPNMCWAGHYRSGNPDAADPIIVPANQLLGENERLQQNMGIDSFPRQKIVLIQHQGD